MYELLKNDLNHIEELLDTAKRQSLHFLKELETRPTLAKGLPPEQMDLHEKGIGAKQALQLFNEKFEKLIVASSGPRYWGFVTGGATPASIIGDWLTSVYDQNTQGTSGQGDVSAAIEVATIDLLLDLFKLPKDFFGGFVTGATMSNFTCLGVARQWVGKHLGKDFAREGITEQIQIYSATPHSSAIKSLSMLGIGSNNVKPIKVASGNRECLDVDDLERQLVAANGEPFVLISSAGTVNTVDFDDFEAIALLRERYKFWWHLDAAFGAFAALSSSHQHLLTGWEKADSITVDCHKWLNVPYENAFFLIKKEHQLLQLETFQNSNAAYLGDPLDNFSYLNFLPENSRRLKALPVWFSLTAYGRAGYEAIVANAIEMASLFGKLVAQENALALLAPIRLNTVCFTLADIDKRGDVSGFLKKINDTGKVFMTPTVYNGQKGIRAAFVNWRTSENDVNLVMQEIKKILTD